MTARVGEGSTGPKTAEADKARLEAIWRATINKLKEVVREYEITQDELHVAGDFLDRLGKAGMCRSLIDVALAMTSVEALDVAKGGTRSNLEGPYYGTHPVRPNGRLFEREPSPSASLLTLSGTVYEAETGVPAAHARLDFWQADENGHYDRAGNHLRGVVFADDAGHYEITTIIPSDYAEHDHDPIGELFRAMGRTNTRAAHIHLKVSTGSTLRLTTQLFLPTSSFLERDYVEGAVSSDLTLFLIEQEQADASEPRYAATFDVFLGSEAT
jgi:protocatechuate 3,4-dioxygenase beta subunit